MQFTTQFRKNFAKLISIRYSAYAQAMHPLNFDPMEYIYRHSFSDELWAALMLIRRERPAAIHLGNQCTFIPFGNNRVWFFLEGDPLPHAQIHPHEIKNLEHRRHVVLWVAKLYEYKKRQAKLKRVCGQFMEDFNTPGQLYRFWPTLLPYLPKEQREQIRSAKTKSALPKCWRIEETREQFFRDPDIQHLEEALLAMSLIPDTLIENYPTVRYY